MAKEYFLEKLGRQIDYGKELIESGPNEKIPIELQGWTKVVSSYLEDKEYESLRSKYTLWNDYNVELLKASFDKPDNDYLSSYKSAGSYISGFRQKSKTMILREGICRKIENLQGLFNKIELIPSTFDATPPMKKESKRNVLTKKVFIVHGHNEEMKQTVARVVAQLGFKPIILHEQANGGKTIIEKFERNAEDINFAIILLSADDLAASVRELNVVKDEELRQHLEMRARQNVVFEMGYFAGKLGRANVFFLLQEGVAKPGDLDGIVYTAYDAAHIWRFELVKELKNAGYKVSADQVL